VLLLLHEDHEEVQSQFEGFQTAGGDDRYFLATRMMRELELHARLEEDSFYPVLSDYAEEHAHTKGASLIKEALGEHRAIQDRIMRIKESPAHGEAYTAEIEGLMQQVQRHVRKEEQEIFPLTLALLGEVELTRLRQNMDERKQELGHDLAA